MSKYQPLHDYLLNQSSPRLELTLPEIERIIGCPLPPSAYAPRWWIAGRNSRACPPWQKAWLTTGYVACLPAGSDRVEFRKLR